MADVQALFEKFHRAIRTDYDTNQTLREKKDIIVDRVKAHLAKNKRPGCSEYLQGSYKMRVGVCALAGSEFDIDVGLRFSFSDADFAPADVRAWVFEAVDGHTQKVEEMGPCIRVTYVDGYHVDLVSYAWWDDMWGRTQYRLAHKDGRWLPADPPGLVEHVQNARKPYEGTEDTVTLTDQFRRVVRYLKRWNDYHIRGESNDKPSGLALVLITEKLLGFRQVDWRGIPDDRLAVERIADAAASMWGRIQAHKPTPEHEDMFGRLSEQAMSDLKDRFRALRDALVFAKNASDATDACKRLKQVFGDDFPCPEGDGGREAEARRTNAPAIITSSNSA